MCGRYTLTTPADALFEELELVELPDDLPPRYNIAPSQEVPVVGRREGAEHPRLVTMRWGLVPHWAKDPKIGYRMINARRESLADKPAFRDSFARKRCLVPADGFYEWRKVLGRKHKQPYHIHLPDHGLFTFAGLWASWKQPDGTWLRSCAIVTQPAAGVVREIHDRMPVIVPRALRATWLDPAAHDPAALEPLLEAFPAAELVAHPVTPLVGSPGHDSPDCIAPLEGDALAALEEALR